MNTNTLEQAVELYHLDFRPNIETDDCHHTKVKNLPALTLDELSTFFERLSEIKKHCWIFPIPDIKKGNKLWHISLMIKMESEGKRFARTKNHAEDWTNILIWLLNEGHVTAEQASKLLEG